MNQNTVITFSNRLQLCSTALDLDLIGTALYGPYSIARYGRTVLLLNSPWSSPKKIRFRKFWRSYLDQNLLRITNPVSDLTGDQ